MKKPNEMLLDVDYGMGQMGGYHISREVDDAHVNYHIRVFVPTDIYQPKRAFINAYEENYRDETLNGKRGRLVAQDSFRLEKMPRWNIPYQCLELGRNDTKKLKAKCSKLERGLGIKN